ncbi:ketopantoate reductase family protein [Phascolarctobacterium sp.]|uniref:ketopantoate reductase family protein n=1 Tax=Phascolarctobacterium sp. TaxID=2049039 RepID=UPI00386FDA37
MEIKKIAIVGMGALGLMYGEMITKACGNDTVVYVMDAERYNRHQNDVYIINGVEQHFHLQSAEEAQPVDLVIVATKFSGLEAALQEMRGLVGSQTIIFSVLNGISSEEFIKERFGDDNLLYCVALGMDAVREGTTLTYEHTGMLKIGCVEEKQRPALDAVTAFLDKAGIIYTVEADILHALWAKLLLNVGINQTCMVYATGYGGAFDNDKAREDMFDAMHEVIAVAQKEGVNLTEADFESAVKVLRGLAYDGLPSMRQDALAKRPSEVELFAGTIIRLGAKHGVDVPVNQRYYECIKAMEAAY